MQIFAQQKIIKRERREEWDKKKGRQGEIERGRIIDEKRTNIMSVLFVIIG